MFIIPRPKGHVSVAGQGPNLYFECAGFGQTLFTDLLFSCACAYLALLDFCCQEGLGEGLGNCTKS